MKGADKEDARDNKLQMWIDAGCVCHVCGDHVSSTAAQLAHRIPKGYVKTYGPEIIHHRFNMRITCSDCNSKVLLSPAAHPIEAAALIEKIKKDLEVL